jgi:hypothetical protein
VALIPLLWSLRGARPGRGALLGLVFGLAFFGATLYWIFLFGALAWFALTALSAASIAVVGAIGSSMLRDERPIRSAIGFAALWTAVDWIRGMFPLGGFTWGSIGISQVDDRAVLPLATLAGVWGITFVVVMANALLFAAIRGKASLGFGRQGSSFWRSPSSSRRSRCLSLNRPVDRSTSPSSRSTSVRRRTPRQLRRISWSPGRTSPCIGASPARRLGQTSSCGGRGPWIPPPRAIPPRWPPSRRPSRRSGPRPPSAR